MKLLLTANDFALVVAEPGIKVFFHTQLAKKETKKVSQLLAVLLLCQPFFLINYYFE